MQAVIRFPHSSNMYVELIVGFASSDEHTNTENVLETDVVVSSMALGKECKTAVADGNFVDLFKFLEYVFCDKYIQEW